MTEDILSELKSVADPKRRGTYKTMFPTSMEYLGIRAPAMRILIKKWWLELEKCSPEKLISLAKELVNTRNFEANQVAFELLS